MTERVERNIKRSELESHRSVSVHIHCFNCQTEGLRVVTFYNIKNYANGLTEESAEQHIKAQISAVTGICSGCHKNFQVYDEEVLRIARILRDGRDFDAKGE